MNRRKLSAFQQMKLQVSETWEIISKDLEFYLEENDKVKSVPPLAVATKMQEHMTIVKINDRLAVYNIDKGIYETRADFFHNVIFWLEPSFSEAKSNQVIFHLKTWQKKLKAQQAVI